MTHTQKSPAATGRVDQLDTDSISLFPKQGKSFPDLFPAQRRSAIANRFCYAVRAGCDNPFTIVTQALCESRRHRDNETVAIIRANLDAAYEFAAYILERERLPRERRKQIKEQSAALYREEYLKRQGATERQIDYLRALGCKEEVRSKWEAMQLIEKMTK